MECHEALRKYQGAGRWGRIFTFFHVFVANIVFKWRTIGVLMRLKTLIYSNWSVYIHIHHTHNDRYSISTSKASFLTWFSVNENILYFRRNSHKYPRSVTWFPEMMMIIRGYPTPTFMGHSFRAGCKSLISAQSGGGGAIRSLPFLISTRKITWQWSCPSSCRWS